MPEFIKISEIGAGANSEMLISLAHVISVTPVNQYGKITLSDGRKIVTTTNYDWFVEQLIEKQCTSA